MSFSIPAIIRALATSLVAPDCRLTFSRTLWQNGLEELRHRGNGERESGAFVLGYGVQVRGAHRRRAERLAYYDDLDPSCLDTGIIVFDGAGYGPLWALCRATGLSVIADMHTHPTVARQSEADRRNPMIAKAGHFAIIVPDYAERDVGPENLGLYEYAGGHRWHDHTRNASKLFRIGEWV
jgi:proteasome lid subunit RPN8/RPN11